jgi:hypothetical protein
MVTRNCVMTVINLTLIHRFVYIGGKESGWLSRYSDELRAGRPWFDSRQGQAFSLLHTVQTGSGAYPSSYPVGTMGSFPRGKAAGE